MNNYQHNAELFMQKEDYDSLTGQNKGDLIAFKDFTYIDRKTEMLPGFMHDKMLEQVQGPVDSSLYLHIPFCNLHCTYCGFYREHFSPEQVERYVQALLQDLDLWYRKGVMQKRHFKAVFFGGGTPSVLNTQQIRALLAKIREVAPLAKDCEITFESSLYDIDEEKLQACLEGGVNRFSFGVQSFDTDLRRSIGRTGSREEVVAKLKSIAQCKATIIIDLIYGLPGQNRVLLLRDIELALSCGVSGMDLYKLQIMPKSPLGQALAAKRIVYEHTEEQLWQMFLAADGYLQRCGVDAISCCHWASNSREKSVYNTLVKNGTDIVACGCSCGGRLGRYQFMKSLSREDYQKNIMQGKLTMMGISKSPLSYVFLEQLSGQVDKGRLSFALLPDVDGTNWEKLLQPLLDKWLGLGLLQRDREGYTLTAKGKFYYKYLDRILLTMVEFIMYGPIGMIEAAGQKMLGAMKNLK